jgi:hypothetical protein
VVLTVRLHLAPKSKIYCQVYVCHSRRGFGLEIGFINHFNTGLVTTLNYDAIANFHTLYITRAPVKSFPACTVFTRSCLVTASNNGYSSASVLKSALSCGSLATASFPHRLPYRTDLVAPTVFLITPLHGPSRKHRLQQYLCCCMRIRSRGTVFTGPVPRNESCFRAVH